jgi:hypothetical protein
MIGGAPMTMMPSPGYPMQGRPPAQFPMAGQPMPQYNVPAAMASSVPMTASPQPAPPSVPMQAAPAPVFRGVPEETPDYGPPPLPVAQMPMLAMPSPEQLGLDASHPASGSAVDWNGAHARLEKLGATCFQEETLPDGSCRVTCLLPTARPSQSHRIEVCAASAAEAIRTVIDEAEQWQGLARK